MTPLKNFIMNRKNHKSSCRQSCFYKCNKFCCMGAYFCCKSNLTPCSYKNFIESYHIRTKFQRVTSKIQREVDFFEPFMDALRSLGHTFAEKIHGRHIVEFDGNNTGNQDCRCELADIAILCYSNKQKTLRLTFNQVKLAKHSFSLVEPPFFFLANKKQWQLLSGRYKFSPYQNRKTFNSDILKDALLPSIGSFGVFYKDDLYRYEFKYFIADLLTLDPTSKCCKLHFNGEIGRLRIPNNTGFQEIEDTSNLDCFFCALKNGLIGSPIMELLGNNGFYKSLMDAIEECKNATNELPSNVADRKNANIEIIGEVTKLIEFLRLDVTDKIGFESYDDSKKFSIRNMVILCLD